MDIAGSTILVTGVTGGIGQALVTDLADRGANLVVTGRRADALEQVAAPVGARSVLADLADPDDVSRLAAECADVDVLVANAALPSTGALLDYTPEQVDRALQVNLRAPIMLGRLLAPHMVEAGRGQLVFIGSMAGKAATAGSSLYNATKFGLRGFSLALRQDLHGTGVGVSIVQPGFVRDAGMFADSGAAPPPGMGTVSPAQVVEGVVRAIEKDLGEVNVAPVATRVLGAVAGQFPGVAEMVQRSGVGERSLQEIVRGQRDKR